MALPERSSARPEAVANRLARRPQGLRPVRTKDLMLIFDEHEQ